MIITVHGKGGHASEPHRTLDPIPVACEIVQALQTMITRSIDVFDPAVVTVGRITAGTTNNVIPETAEIDGTIRAVSERTRAKVHDGIRRVAEGIAAAHGCAIARCEIDVGYPVTVNDDRFADVRARSWPTDVSAPTGWSSCPHPIMGAEDFSYVLQQRPGGDDVPRRHTRRPRPDDGRAEPLQPGVLRRAGDGHRHRPVRHRGAATPPPELTFASGFRRDGPRKS